MKSRRRPLRVMATAVSGLVLGVVVAFALGSGGGAGDGYQVRVVFDNASFIIPGEDVKVAGVKVGTVTAVDLTAQDKAAVVIRIDDPAFRPFRADAHCSIGLQSLIGEQFVDCVPTRPRSESAPVPPELATIKSGPGAGEHLLSVSHTTTPVGVDLLNNIMRLPEQERFRLIINELGAGLAGNGQALRAALHRANPALGELDRVVGILAGQNHVLGQLADESDRVLGPMAAARRHFGEFIDHAGSLGAATAARGDALEANVAKLPAFLRQLRPAANRFAALADQMTPGLQTLHSQAPNINATIAGLGQVSSASIPALKTLGDVAQRGSKTFPQINSLAQRLRDLGIPLRPLAKTIAALASNFDQRGGIEQVMRFIYFYTGTVNGEDSAGHYIRSMIELGACSARSSTPTPGCPSNFDKTGETGRAVAASTSRRLLDYLLGSGK